MSKELTAGEVRTAVFIVGIPIVCLTLAANIWLGLVEILLLYAVLPKNHSDIEGENENGTSTRQR